MIRWAERCALLLLVLYVCFHTMPRAWHSLITDFPNYYMSARLAHENYDTSRMYEWDWLQREKDHRAVDVRVIGLVPITPFSTLIMWPLTKLAPLAAKHIWIIANLALLFPLCWLLRSMTGLTYRRIALVFALSVPFYRNLEYGQFYVFLLLLIVMACWAYLRKYYVWAGALVAIAAACKVFPVLFFVFFLQRRSWRALISGVITGLAAAVLSVAVFGWNVHRTYLHEILPWTLHGEVMPPYVTTASFSSVLHSLFLSEPQWNPHPWHYSPLCYALLLPALQTLMLAPAVLLIRREDSTRGRIMLEWSALLTASLAISTVPASYNFVLMALPMCVLAAELLRRRSYTWLAALLVIYLGIGFPMPIPHREMGLGILLYVPRLPLMLAALVGTYGLLWHDRSDRALSRDWTRYAWAAVMAVSVLSTMFSTFHRERAVRQEYAYRLPLQTQGFLNANAQRAGTGVHYVAFMFSGYHLVTEDQNAVWSDPSSDSLYDDLSFTSSSGSIRPERILVERALKLRSRIVDVREPMRIVVDDARDPMLSADGQDLAFMRDDHGQGKLMERRAFESDTASQSVLTPSSLNVYEASFLSEKEYAFSAAVYGRPPQIYLNDATHTNALLGLGESRYPALSPDGRWMAYSRFDHGVWNLWLRDQRTGATQHIVDEPCNQIQPAWETDSKTLLYSTDCGRSLWFTAISRRRVVF
ncbi:glycosyltransferase 87 family protein [Granulicella sp. S156]|uniref:glycosyltransferase 87 family protein n=1 Tax=Granulicella sp. S156 TaxID=1747224 RepID=UPI00131DFB0C|nr:glycosyltransferase 87 family protein [Granulicella sp. S156]